MEKAVRMLSAGDRATDKNIDWKCDGGCKESLRKIIHEQRLNKMTYAERMRWLNGEFK